MGGHPDLLRDQSKVDREGKADSAIDQARERERVGGGGLERERVSGGGLERESKWSENKRQAER